jgi:hypothetical protein
MNSKHSKRPRKWGDENKVSMKNLRGAIELYLEDII